MRQSIIDKGVDVPDDAKIEEYAGYILQIEAGGGEYSPTNPTLEGVKDAVSKGMTVKTGLEIPDTYGGKSNPLVVVHNLSSANNTQYGGAVGTILIRKYVDPTAQAFGYTANYADSTLKSFLETTYIANCSNELRAVISNITVPYWNGSAVASVETNIFPMSDTEVMSSVAPTISGEIWDYWREKTGLAAPDTRGQANNGRILRDSSSAARYVWLRSVAVGNEPCMIASNGSVDYYTSTSPYGVIPAFFIAKGGN